MSPRVACLTALLALAGAGLGGGPGLRAQSADLRFEQFGLDEGFPSTRVHVLVEDHLGYLWVAGDEGLCRYDGYSCVPFRHDPRDSTTISGNELRSGHVDRTGTFWAPVRGAGLNRFDPVTQTFERILHDPADPNSPSSNHLGNIAETPDGALWFSDGYAGLVTKTGVALNRFDPATRTFHHVYLDSTLFALGFEVLHANADGTLWVGIGSDMGSLPSERGGLYLYDPAANALTWHLGPGETDGLVDSRITALHEEANGTLWIGTCNMGLHRYDPATGDLERYLFDPGDPESLRRQATRSGPPIARLVPCVMDFLDGADGALWFAGEGVTRFDRTTRDFTHYTSRPHDRYSLASIYAPTLHQSRDGTVWVGTYSGGVNKVVPGFRRSTYVDSVGSVRTFSFTDGGFHEDPDGTLWIGTTTGLFRLRPGTPVADRYVPDGGVNGGTFVNAVAGAPDGRIWIGTHVGLRALDPATDAFTVYRHDPDDPTSLSHDIVYNVHVDQSGGVWAGTDTGLNRLRPGSDRFDRLFVDASVYRLIEDHAGQMWAGANDNLYRFDLATGDATPVLADSVLAWHPFEDRAGRLWIGTAGDGLLHYDRETGATTAYTLDDGLPSNHVLFILQDGLDRLWVATDLGLVLFDPATGEVLDTLGPDDGPVMGLFLHSAYRRRDGQFLFGGRSGVVTIYPEQIRPNLVPPRVVIERVRLANDYLTPGADRQLTALPWDPDARLALAHDENDLTIEYVGLHFKEPEGNHYRYRLDGYDDAWVEAGTQRAARYTNVPPGRYTFRVTAANSDGVWNETPAALAVVVHPPWWRTLPAYLAYALLAVGALVLASRAQRRRIERVERERAMAREVEQAREIEAVNARLATANARLRAHEAQLEAQNERLRELDTLKSRFFANISHEFRTPLTLILGPLRDLLDERLGPVGPAHQGHLTLMQRNAERLLRLINQLLDLAKLDAGQMRLRACRTDIGPLVAATAQAFASLAERESVALEVDVPAEPVWLWVEPEKLEQVLVNLLANAFKFTPEGGTVSVAVRPDTGPDVGSVEIEVRDTGEGIPAEMLPHVFDRFRQADGSSTRQHEGTGIGLALVQELVELHGGTVAVESAVGVGTTFTLRLPTGHAHLPDEALDKEQIPAGGDGTYPTAFEPTDLRPFVERNGQGADRAEEDSADETPDEAPLVLIVEDNADVRAYLRAHLADQYRIAEAADGEAGLAQARALGPALVLSDVMMPKMDGLALCRALKADEATAHLPVILLTAKADAESRLDGLGTGADDYLAKPFSADELLVRVENLIELRRRLRARFSGEVVVQPVGVTVSSEAAGFVEEVRAVVEAEMHDAQFSVERLAEAMSLSPRQLRRRLKAASGLSPSGFVRGMRLARAAELLEQEAGRVTEVAYAVGFASASHFSRLFQQVYGVAPSEHGQGGPGVTGTNEDEATA